MANPGKSGDAKLQGLMSVRRCQPVAEDSHSGCLCAVLRAALFYFPSILIQTFKMGEKR